MIPGLEVPSGSPSGGRGGRGGVKGAKSSARAAAKPGGRKRTRAEADAEDNANNANNPPGNPVGNPSTPSNPASTPRPNSARIIIWTFNAFDPAKGELSAIPTIDLDKCPRKEFTPPSAQAQEKGRMKSKCWALGMDLNFDMKNLEEVEGLEPCIWWNYD
jgi:hypothetical protein